MMTSAGALIHGLQKMGAKKISLLAPYMKPLTDKVVAYIENEGIEVIDRICFEIPDNLEVGKREPMRLSAHLHVANLTNQLSFTEGDPLFNYLLSPDGTRNRGVARPLFGRIVRFSLTYMF
jgi:maleate cis-trans isomerase